MRAGFQYRESAESIKVVPVSPIPMARAADGSFKNVPEVVPRSLLLNAAWEGSTGTSQKTSVIARPLSGRSNLIAQSPPLIFFYCCHLISPKPNKHPRPPFVPTHSFHPTRRFLLEWRSIPL